MRLHNRIVTAGFWGDPELSEWPRDQRFTYHGLWQLAEDSGCVEYSPRAVKGSLWPMDEDITIAQVSSWIDAFILTGKAILYQVDGKAYLYLKNFSKYQKINSPSTPDLPLPSWIEFIPFPSNARTGKYVIHDENLAEYRDEFTTFLQTPYTLLTDFLQIPSKGREGKVREGKLQARASAPTREESPAGEQPHHTPPQNSLKLSIPADITPARLPCLYRLTEYTLREYHKLVYPLSVTVDQMRTLEEQLQKLDGYAKTLNPDEDFLSALQMFFTQYDDGMKQASYLKSDIAKFTRFALQDYGEKVARMKKREKAPAYVPETPEYVRPEPPPEYDPYLDKRFRPSAATMRREVQG